MNTKMNKLEKLIEKWEEKHSSLLNEYTSTQGMMTERELCECRTHMKNLLEIIEDLKQQLSISDVSCSVVHCKKAPYDIYIGRPSKWGNPFTHRQDGKTLAKYIVGSREEAVEAYREWITNGEGKHLMKDLPELKNKVIGCWCKPKSCHGDILSELVSKHCK